jgi:hypothetical protein
MSPKTAIIILLILFLLGVLVFVYLFAIGYFSPKLQPKEVSQPITTQPVNQPKLSPDQEKQKMLEKLNQLTDQEKQKQLENLTPKEKVKVKQEMLNKLNALSE